MRVGVFHPGTQHAFQTAIAFQEAGRLAWHATSVFYDPSRWPYRVERLLPTSWSQRLHNNFIRRYHPALERRNVRQFGIWEWIETAALRLGSRRLASWINDRGNRSFGHSVVRLIEQEPVDVIWGYNTSSLEVFRWAKPRGVRCVLDQATGHCASMNEVMRNEQLRNPEFFRNSYKPFSAVDIARQNEEIALADLVVVGSEFCARTMIDNGCSPEKIRVIPYGYDEALFPTSRPERQPVADRPVRFLYLGLASPAKGVAHLLKAFERMSPKEAMLTMVGGIDIPEDIVRRYRERVEFVGWKPRSELMPYFAAADCLIFPSLFEGGGLVLYEAAAAGLAIIQSSSAGDGVRGGENGIVLPIISADRIENTVRTVLKDRSILSKWQDGSWRIHEDRTWAQYRREIRALTAA